MRTSEHSARDQHIPIERYRKTYQSARMTRLLRYASLCLLLLVAPAAQAAPPPSALVQCLKEAEGEQSSQLTTYQDFVKGQATRYALNQGLWPGVSWQASPAELSHRALLLTLTGLLAACLCCTSI
jgi:hypothetical protein